MTNELSSTARQKMIRAHILAFITIFIWGTTYISTKMLLKEFSPTEILFYRFILAYLALLAACPARIKYSNIKEELLFACAGLCGVTLYFILQNTSLVYTLASNAGVLISVAPFFTAILSWFLLKGETLRKGFFIGFGVSIIGVGLISHWMQNDMQVPIEEIGELMKELLLHGPIGYLKLLQSQRVSLS